MNPRNLILSGIAVVLISAPLALAGQGGHGGGGYIQTGGFWLGFGWRGGHGHQELGGPWQYAGQGNLPPGLAKRDRLPPGLEKHLWKHGSLPPGLQKKVDPYGFKGGKKRQRAYGY